MVGPGDDDDDDAGVLTCWLAGRHDGDAAQLPPPAQQPARQRHHLRTDQQASAVTRPTRAGAGVPQRRARLLAPVAHDQTPPACHLRPSDILLYILLTERRLDALACCGGTSGSASAFSLPASVIWQLKGQLCTDGVLTMQVGEQLPDTRLVRGMA